MPNQLPKIDHIVHLMLENRSFDQMLGFLYHPTNVSPRGDQFNGLTGNESNPDERGVQHKVYKIQSTDPHPYFMPGADPGEGYDNTNVQLFSSSVPPAQGAVPTNDGFVLNFKAAIASDLAHHYKDSLPGTLPQHIMGMYPPELLPILSGLAANYAVCDEWFASVPTMTMPNRAFALAGTSQGHLDDTSKRFSCKSIFSHLSDAGQDWAVFGYNADPKTRMDFSDTRAASDTHFGQFQDFQARASAGTLPAYTFLEPSWDSSGNSQHPNYDVSKGEQLIREIYDTLLASPNWSATLFIITYDEHGGNYDHVPPPWGATPPGDGTVPDENFGFDRFGVRVPAVLVSPWIQPGTVFRASAGKVIDHTSVLRTIHGRFGTQPLSQRDAAAASLGDVLNAAARNTADRIPGVVPPASTAIHPNTSSISKISMMHADAVSSLPLRNAHGYFEEGPRITTASSAADIDNFIRDRTAAWKARRR
ncbi:phosphoesterase [Caballeronia sp. SEWSISQ10-4 2]|uniref:alkaline phosphatase family protein n=1 Tax=Caballeronia sp. SEWSISQ10-4 2 TaxID=2937438 RepID=UPI00264B649C|nr:alkaline phosphatase family protein [Caballeronia sp. SEWSISQ10-4 2]MDN7179673.1 phosphoesterase [Caballeronia sp. SEWSISQ10-4 2]